MSVIDTMAPEAAELDALAAYGLAVAMLADRPVEDEMVQGAVLDLVCTAVETFATDGASAAAHAALGALSPEQAALGCDLLMLALFPEGNADLAALDDAALLTAVALLGAAGRLHDAVKVLSEADAKRPTRSFRRATFAARCRLLGHDVAGLWLSAAPAFADADAARAGILARPLDLEAHRALARRLAEAGALGEALEALSVALTLPLGDRDKAPLVPDLAVLVTLTCAQGETALFDVRRVRMALAANAVSAASALALLGENATPLAAAAGDPAMAQAAALLQHYANPRNPVARSPYPIVGGRPHADIVWLEITNFCNQKCTFCPDMHREDPRAWLPLAEVKRLIDELAETVSVGSMQLNAYGEPLLHPNIAEILAYIRDKQLPFPTFFTTHGMTLVPKKLAQLSHNYPAGIAVSLHNDSQESYALTRSAKIGDYETLVERVAALTRQMVNEQAPTHLRLYQMVSNGHEDMRVDPLVRAAFPETVERMTEHLRKWEAIGAAIAAAAPPQAQARAIVNPVDKIAASFHEASHGDGVHLPIVEWTDVNGHRQQAFLSPRPVGTYANLLLEYHPDWQVARQVVNSETCSFVNAPALAIFASRRLGICCLDLNSTATFASLDDHAGIAAAMTSPAAARMFAQVANGVAVSKGCQICLSSGTKMCGR